MEEKQLRKLLLERLHLEMQLFKDSMLLKEKEAIYSANRRIEVYMNLYEILVVRVERMGEPLMRNLLYQETGILDDFYEEWPDSSDGFYMELRDYVEDGLRVLAERKTNGGKEDGNGEKANQAS